MIDPNTSAAIQAASAVVTLLLTIGLVLFTARYVRLTGELLKNAQKQALLAANPVLGIRIQKILIGENFGPDRQDMGVEYELANLSDAPAIGVTIDGEVILRFVDVKGRKRIPQRFEPESIEYLRAGEVLSADKWRSNLSFGNFAARATLDDLLEEERLNFERIERDATQDVVRGPRLRLVVRYSNNLGQGFKTEWEADLGVWNKDVGGGWKIPDRRENIEITHMYIPRPVFTAGPESASEAKADLERMDANRKYSGW